MPVRDRDRDRDRDVSVKDDVTKNIVEVSKFLERIYAATDSIVNNIEELVRLYQIRISKMQTQNSAEKIPD